MQRARRLAANLAFSSSNWLRMQLYAIASTAVASTATWERHPDHQQGIEIAEFLRLFRFMVEDKLATPQLSLQSIGEFLGMLQWDIWSSCWHHWC
jgi:hypothetical protein